MRGVPDGVVVWDGLDGAVVGLELPRDDGGPQRLLYDYGRMVDLLVDRDGMSVDEAFDYIDFNVVGAYVGPGTPVVVDIRRDWDAEE